MGIFRRRRRRAATKEEALAEARRAVDSLRRDQADLERYRSGKQSEPADRMTQNQWLGSGG
ncbi:hypothetical protein KDN32_03125 [Nocardioides sp. J2M5]|uniref:hypothetical protein n=1 Tax=Nocardioides palaemonis TaxID=2829810 RepID=UPI001BAD4B0D|nr:hypothetical protein [Nocardioides palaemonis]MBS2936731.1 hypothetical protein [Nocardioides palaemonis]